MIHKLLIVCFLEMVRTMAIVIKSHSIISYFGVGNDENCVFLEMALSDLYKPCDIFLKSIDVYEVSTILYSGSSSVYLLVGC